MMNNNNTFHSGPQQLRPVSQPPGSFSLKGSTPPRMPQFMPIAGMAQEQGRQSSLFPQGPVPGQRQPLSSSSSQGTAGPARPSGRKKLAAIIISGICLAALLGIIGFAWLLAKGTPDVTVYQVGVHDVNQYVGGGGIIFPRRQVAVSYPATERVVSVHVKAGDRVSVNQPLIKLDSSQLNTQIKQASDDLDAAQAYLNSIVASGKALQIAQAQQAYNVAKSKYNALVAEATSPLHNKGNLISPMNGIVTAVNISPGEVFPANTVLITIMDESTMIVHVKVPLANLTQVHIGQAAVVTSSALPDLNFNGTVSTIISQASPQADPQASPQAGSQIDTFEVWINVANSDRKLLPGMSAFVRTQSASQRYFVLPRLAVLNPDRESVVFVVRNQHAYLQHVHIVGRSINSIFVDSGLSAGDKVVLVGIDKLQNGQKVHVTGVESQTS